MNTCFGCINDGRQGSDYSDCWKCKNHSLYDEDDEFTEIKNKIRADAIDDFLNEVGKSIIWDILAEIMVRNIGASDGADRIINYLNNIAEQIKGTEE